MTRTPGNLSDDRRQAESAKRVRLAAHAGELDGTVDEDAVVVEDVDDHTHLR